MKAKSPADRRAEALRNRASNFFKPGQNAVGRLLEQTPSGVINRPAPNAAGTPSNLPTALYVKPGGPNLQFQGFDHFAPGAALPSSVWKAVAVGNQWRFVSTVPVKAYLPASGSTFFPAIEIDSSAGTDITSYVAPFYGAGSGVSPRGHGFPGHSPIGPNAAYGAPNAVSGVAGFGDDCSTSDDCGSGLVCTPFGVCAGIPISIPPAVCGPHSSPSASTVSCACDNGYHDDGTGTCVEDIKTGVPGNLVDPCVDDLGNAGYKDSAGLCIGTQCGSGQGRGDTTNACLDCGVNGFKADGITCNECPPGSSGVNASTGLCDCPAGKQWNANYTACISPPAPGSPPPPPPPPVPKCDPKTQVYDLTTNSCVSRQCNPQTQQFDASANAGAGACITKPGGGAADTGGGYTTPLIIGAGLLLGAVILASGGKKKGGGKKKRKK